MLGARLTPRAFGTPVTSKSFYRAITSTPDVVNINKIGISAIVGNDSWGRPSLKPICVSVSLFTDFGKASETDALKYSLNYAVITRNIVDLFQSKKGYNFKSLKNVAEEVAQVALDKSIGGGQDAQVVVADTKSEMRADCVEFYFRRSTLDPEMNCSSIKVHKLRLFTLIGVFTFERLKKQIVDIDIIIDLKPHTNANVSLLVEEVSQYVESANFKTMEALVFTAGFYIFRKHGNEIRLLTLDISKPNAIVVTEGVGVASTFTADSFEGMIPLDATSRVHLNTEFNLPTESPAMSFVGHHVAYIAFGSNQGEPIKNIHRAMELLAKSVTIEATSSMYISKPMYHTDQPDFYNGVVKVSFADYCPQNLLRILKEIEYSHMSRVKDFDNGPRIIDLDIILYDSVSINIPELTIPHKSMLERTFVMQPLCEIILPSFIHPVSAEPLYSHLFQLLKSIPKSEIQESSHLCQIVPVPRSNDKSNSLVFDNLNQNIPAIIMGILNITPDSFSDGGSHFGKDLSKVVDTARKMIHDGALILDIGGASTRPGSTPPSISEELQRIIPVIKAIRESTDAALSKCLILVDTYRAEVAQASLEAGADIINDISAGVYDERIFDVVAKYQCPYIASHTRGSTETMLQFAEYKDSWNEDLHEGFLATGTSLSTHPPVIMGVARELSLQLLKAFKRGVKKWQVIIDPGFGFAKNTSHNLILIRNAAMLKRYFIQATPDSYFTMSGMAMLMGPSRKKFLGSVTGENDASKRVTSTAALVVACVQQDVDIVRVHDVREMKIAVDVANAIYRQDE